MQASEQAWRRQGQQAAGFRLLAGQMSFGHVEVAENPAAGLQIGLTRLRQSQTPRGSGDKTRVEVLFQRLEVAAHRGQRHAEPFAGRRKRACVGNGHEHPDCAQPIHLFSQILEQYIFYFLHTAKNRNKPYEGRHTAATPLEGNAQ